ncbi:MAG TPA: hypothetical protein VH815_06715, partial [Acidobacteriota bacterium]
MAADVIRIHLFNTDGYPISSHVSKSIFSTLAQGIYQHFIQKYPNETIVCCHYMVLKQIYQNGSHVSGVIGDHSFLTSFADQKISSQCIVIEYPDGELRAIDLTDRNDDILKLAALENFTGGMVFQYDPLRFKKEPKLHPGYYSTRGFYTSESDDVQQFVKYVTKNNPKLYFRGPRTHKFRSCLEHLASYPDAEVYENTIEPEDYFAEFGSHKIVLGLPGRGDLCFRDFEAFALNIPLLRPEYSVSLAQPLIPDYHYLRVSVTDPDQMELLARDIMTRYYEVIGDQNFLDFIANNAFEYYTNF